MDATFSTYAAVAAIFALACVFLGYLIGTCDNGKGDK